MRHAVHLCVFAALLAATPSWAQVGPGAGAEPGGGEEEGTTACPEYLVAEFNGSYFYQEMDCPTGQMLPGVQRYMSQIDTGCDGTSGCNCDEPDPSEGGDPGTSGGPSLNQESEVVGEAPLTQQTFANPSTDILVPFGRGASSYLGPAKRIIKAGEKTFVVISMRLKGKTTTVGAPDNEMDVIVEFGQEVDPSTNPTTNVGTLVDNTLTFGSQDFTVTLMGMGATQ
ncbi:MAG: hypothetical protein D6753_15695 [Planctomycetota bacterium]|nr:MAG: hypothetical protein D6753_15695 [Planctomycetota bacterium]